MRFLKLIFAFMRLLALRSFVAKSTFLLCSYYLWSVRPLMHLFISFSPPGHQRTEACLPHSLIIHQQLVEHFNRICIFTWNCGRCCPLGPGLGLTSPAFALEKSLRERRVQADGKISDCGVLNCSAPQH